MGDKTGEDIWTILGIRPTRDPGVIRQAYLREVRRHHPDRWGTDPVRYAAQEERMKQINAAYQAALRLAARPQPEAPPPPKPDPPPPPPPNRCLDHGEPGRGTCRRCSHPLCRRCPGERVGLCNRHLAASALARARARALAEWGSFALVIVAARLLTAGPGAEILATLATLFVLGVVHAKERPWHGLLALWLFPFGLIALGLKGLYGVLADMERAGYDEALWLSYLNRGLI